MSLKNERLNKSLTEQEMEIELIDERLIQKDSEISFLKEELNKKIKEIQLIMDANKKQAIETIEEMEYSLNSKNISKWPVINCNGKGNIRTNSKTHRTIESCPNFKKGQILNGNEIEIERKKLIEKI